MSHVTTASPKPSFRASGRMGDAVVGRGNSGWTTSQSGHPCPCQNHSQGPRAEKTGRGSPLIRPSCPPDDPIGQGTERNGTEVNCVPREIWSHYSKQVGGQLKRIRLKIAKKCCFYLNIFSCVKISVFRSFLFVLFFCCFFVCLFVFRFQARDACQMRYPVQNWSRLEQMLFECMGTCVLSPVHESELRG